MGSERRETPRFDVNVSVKFRDLEELQTEELKNLSRGGCLAISKTIRPMNSKVPITLVHPTSGEHLDILAEVKRVQPMPNGSWALGLQFVGFDSGLKIRIHRFVESVVEQPSAAPATAVASVPTPWSASGAPRTLTDKKVEEYVASASAALTDKKSEPGEALRYVDLALALAPNRADLHGQRARLLMDRVGDVKSASSHANRAAEIEPGNKEYAALARDYAQKLAALPPSVVGVATPYAQSSSATPSKKPRLGGKRAGPLALGVALVLAVVVGFNVWFLLYRNVPRVRSVDPGAYDAIVPMTKLQIANGRAYGIVKSGWPALADREGKLAALAASLKQEGAGEIVLTDGTGRLVGTWRDGNATLFAAR